MDDGTLAASGEHLAAAIEGERAESAGRWRCSAELRARVVAYADACEADGESQRRVAERLGITQPTLSRWVRQTFIESRRVEADTSFRRVAIVPSRPRSCEAAIPPLRLVTPRGFVVEGLSAELLAVLLRALG